MANRYWVGGSGNWSDSTNHWATSSGGSPGVANTPTHLDNVIFDTLSNATAYTVTMDKEAFCADMTWGNPLVGAPTWAGSTALNIYGSLSLVSGMTRTYTGIITFKATSTGKTITTNSVSIGNGVSFDGVGGGWILQDNFNCSSSFGITRGSIDTNGKTVTCTAFQAGGVNTRTLTLGSSIINCTSINFVFDNLTFNCDTSSIRVTGSGAFTGGGKTFYEVQLNGTAHTISNENTFTNLTRTGTATKTNTITLAANQTVSGTLTLTGNSSINRLLVQSDIKGKARTLTAGTVNCSNIDIQDITGSGAGSWNLSAITGNSGDCGGNYGITFTTGVTQTWSGTTGGTWSTNAWTSRVPLPQDTANLGIAWTAAQTITQDMPRIGSVDWTAATGSPTWTTSTAASVFGSITLISGMTLTASAQTYTMEGRGSYSLTSDTKTWGKEFNFKCPGGTYTIQDTWNSGNNAIVVFDGTLNTNNQTINIGVFTAGSGSSGTFTITLGSSIINCATWIIQNSTSFISTFNSGTSSIRVSSSGNFTGAGFIYYEVQLNGTAHTVSGTNTYTTLTRTGTSLKTDTLTISNNQTITGTLTLAGNSVINRLLVQSTTKGNQVTITAGTVTASNVDIQDINGAGTGNWNLSGITGNSGDCGGNSNITFTSPVTTDWQSGATWSTATWSSRVPLPQDTATFTTAGVATVTQDMPRIGSVDFSTSADKTWTTSTACSVFGSINLTNLATLTASIQLYTFEGRSAYTLNSSSFSWAKQLTVNVPGGSLTLSDDLTTTDNNGITMLHGTFDAGNKNITSPRFTINNGTLARTLNMGSGTWTLNGTSTVWNIGSGVATINPSTSTIKLTSSSGTPQFFGSNYTYNNIWNATTGTAILTIQGNNTFNDLKIDAGRTQKFTAFNIQTINTFTAVGTAGNVITLASDTAGYRAYIKDTSGTNTCDYLSIQDIGVTGGATWIAGSNSTYVSGNIGWSTNPATDRYWVSGGNGYWDSTTNWATSPGGASGASVPIGENVFFDASSGSGEVMIASAPLVNNLDCTGFTGTFIGSSAFSIYGNYKLVAGMTLLSTGQIGFKTNGSNKTFTSGGKTILSAIASDTISDAVTFQDATTSNSSIAQTTGTYDFNNLDHSFTLLSSTNSNTRTITMGSGTMTLTGTGIVWSMATIAGLTLNQNTSTIKITDATSQTKTFSGGGETFNNVWCTGAGTGSFNFIGSNTFNDFKVDTPPHTINFTAGTTTTVTTFTVTGTAGNLMTIGSITAATHTLTKAGGGTISGDYFSISNSTATPATTWYAGTHSTDGGNNSGWSFTSGIQAANASFLFLMAK